MPVKIFTVIEEQFANGSHYKIKNIVSGHVLCTTWRNEVDAGYICEALNLYNDCVRSGIYDKVMKKLISIREYNERQPR